MRLSPVDTVNSIVLWFSIYNDIYRHPSLLASKIFLIFMVLEGSYWSLASHADVLHADVRDAFLPLVNPYYKLPRVECVDIISYSWPPKRQIRMDERFQYALKKRRRGFFGPLALIKLIRATSLAPKWQIHWRNIKNEWYIYDLSTNDKHFTKQDYPSALENC